MFKFKSKKRKNFSKANINKFVIDNFFTIVLSVMVILGGVLFFNKSIIGGLITYVSDITGISAMDNYEESETALDLFNNTTAPYSNAGSGENGGSSTVPDGSMSSSLPLNSNSPISESDMIVWEGGGSTDNNPDIEWIYHSEEDFLTDEVFVDDGEGGDPDAPFDPTTDSEEE